MFTKMWIKVIDADTLPSKQYNNDRPSTKRENTQQKNSKVRTGKHLVSSKAYQERENEQLKSLLAQIRPLKLSRDLHIDYTFYMPDARKTDLSNKVESINDLLVKYWLLEDDNRNIINELNIRCGGIDKENPRCEIQIKLMYTAD